MASNDREPNTVLLWDNYSVHKTRACTAAMAESSTTLLLVPGGLTPKTQRCDGLVNKVFKSNTKALYDVHMASPGVKRDERGYPEARQGGWRSG